MPCRTQPSNAVRGVIMMPIMNTMSMQTMMSTMSTMVTTSTRMSRRMWPRISKMMDKTMRDKLRAKSKVYGPLTSLSATVNSTKFNRSTPCTRHTRCHATVGARIPPWEITILKFQVRVEGDSAWGSGCTVQGSGFKAQGLGLKVRVQGLGSYDLELVGRWGGVPPGLV